MVVEVRLVVQNGVVFLEGLDLLQLFLVELQRQDFLVQSLLFRIDFAFLNQLEPYFLHDEVHLFLIGAALLSLLLAHVLEQSLTFLFVDGLREQVVREVDEDGTQIAVVLYEIDLVVVLVYY